MSKDWQRNSLQGQTIYCLECGEEAHATCGHSKGWETASQKAARVAKAKPTATVREIAARAGVSIGTAHAEKARVQSVQSEQVGQTPKERAAAVVAANPKATTREIAAKAEVSRGTAATAKKPKATVVDIDPTEGLAPEVLDEPVASKLLTKKFRGLVAALMALQAEVVALRSVLPQGGRIAVYQELMREGSRMTDLANHLMTEENENAHS